MLEHDTPHFGAPRWQKGQSGNPGGRYVTRAARRAAELCAALLAELGGAEALSLMDRTLLELACSMMAEAKTSKSQEQKVRLSNAANRNLGKLRDRGRKADDPPLSFDDYLARSSLLRPVDASGGYGTADHIKKRTIGRRRVSKRHDVDPSDAA